MILHLLHNSLCGFGLLVSYNILDKITKGKPIFALLSSAIFFYCVDKIVLSIEEFV